MFGGGAVMLKTTVQCQTNKLDQQNSLSGTPREETKQPDLCMANALNFNNYQEQLLPDNRQLDMVSTKSRAHSVVGGENTGETDESWKDGISFQSGREITAHQNMQHWNEQKDTTERSVSPAVDIFLQAVTEQFKCLEIENTTQKTSWNINQAKAAKQDLIPWDIARLAEEHAKTQAMKHATTEVWDEYVLPTDDNHGGASTSKQVVSSFESNTSTNLDLCDDAKTQSVWHFPAGPGLTEEVRCPPLEFPTGSYYPQLKTSTQFEVIWRVWENLDEYVSAVKHNATSFSLPKSSMDFTVMSYNILAQDLLEVNQELYTHCPLEVLDWKHRCGLILHEINEWSPDILCLQEVQENHYYEQLQPVLSRMGYSCIYKRRTGMKTDGCAICYHKSQFTEITVTSLEFFQPQTELLDRHNVGIVLLLRPVATLASKGKKCGPTLCIANTHLLFNPRRGDVKLAQLAIILAEIDRVIQSCQAKGEQCNVILCGDFNSVPNRPLYQLITTGRLYYQGLPSWMVSGQEDFSYKTHSYRLSAPLWPSSLGITDCCQYSSVQEDQKSPRPGKCRYSHELMLKRRFCQAACVRPQDLPLIQGVTDNTPESSASGLDFSQKSMPSNESFGQNLCHRLDLKSVYKHLLPGSGKPEVTTLNSEMGATVDYIFYSPECTAASNLKDGVRKGLKLLGCLSLLSEEVLLSMNGLPNHSFPSDHLSLLAKFQVELNIS